MSIRVKPAKPWPTFPLYAHSNGQWAKRILGRIHYFGSWMDSEEAHKRYLREHEDLEAGRVPNRTPSGGVTLERALNLCLEAKRIKADSGELSEGAWAEYARIGKRILGVFGRQRLVDDLTPADFSRLRKDFAQTAKSLNSINTYITTTRTFFNFAHREGLIDHPIRYGDAFARPTRTALRRQRQQRPPRLFDASQIHTLLDAAKPQMRAMILLGINCGFGNNDCILLTMRMLDLPVGWIHSPRSKTTIMRHCPLWPETANALQHVLQHREDPIDCQHADRVFIIRQMPWHSKRLRGNLVSDTFTTLQKKTKLRLPGLNFYALRHTFATIGKQTKDNDAVRAILGHVIPANDMLSNNYDEAPVEQHRLLAVSSYVLAWLYPTGE